MVFVLVDNELNFRHDDISRLGTTLHHAHPITLWRLKGLGTSAEPRWSQLK